MSDQHSEHPPQDGSAPPPPAPWPGQQPGHPAQPAPGAPQPGGYPGYPQQPGHPQGQGYPQQPGHPQQPGYPGQPAGPAYGQGYSHPQQRPSTLGGLADLGFTRRITPGLAKVVYIAVVVLAALAAAVAVIGALGAFATAGNRFVGGGEWIFYGLLLLVTGPLGGFVLVAFARFWLEYFLDRAEERR